MHPALALALVAIAFWNGWRLLAERSGDGVSALLLAAVALAASWPAMRRIARSAAAPVPPAPLGAAFLLYAAASLAAPFLVQAAIAVATFLLLCRHVGGSSAPALPLVGLGLLALPVLPSFDFAFAYPMRLACARLTAWLLQLNGVGVSVEGVALAWNGKLLLFDAACSGVRMLWASLFLVSGIALAAQFGPLRYARSLALAVGVTIGASALRAASLFYVENGFVARMQGPVWHEAVGIAAFIMLAATLVLAVAPRAREAT